MICICILPYPAGWARGGSEVFIASGEGGRVPWASPDRRQRGASRVWDDGLQLPAPLRPAIISPGFPPGEFNDGFWPRPEHGEGASNGRGFAEGGVAPTL